MSIVAKRLDIKMPLGMEVNLGPGHIVLDEDPAPRLRAQPQFSAHVGCGQIGRPSQLLLSTCHFLFLSS